MNNKDKTILVFDEETDSHEDLLESLKDVLKNDKPEFKMTDDLVEFNNLINSSQWSVVVINFQSSTFFDMDNTELEDFLLTIKNSQDITCNISGITGNSYQKQKLLSFGLDIGRKKYDNSYLENLLGVKNRDITLEEIEAVVCDFYQIDSSSLHTKSRKRVTTKPRQIIMYLTKQFLGDKIPLKIIGSYFCGRDHGTVLHSRQTVEDLMDTDIEFKNEVTKIREILLY